MRLRNWRDVDPESWKRLSLTLPELSEPRNGLWSSGQFLQEIQSSPLLWVELRGQEVAAMVSLRKVDEGVYEIIYLYTAPEWRRQRLMEGLLHEVFTSLEEGSQFWLEVAASNDKAQGLYEKLGFTHQGVRPKYYSDQTDSWLYHYRGAPAGA